MSILAVLLFVIESERLSLDRAEYLIGRDAIIIGGANYKYLVSPRLPFILIFNEQRQFVSLTFRKTIVLPRDTTKLKVMLQGKWLALPIELNPTDDKRPFILSRLHTLQLTDDMATINYGFIWQRFFYRSDAIGPVLKIGITFPVEQDRLAFAANPDNDHGLSSMYFLPLGNLALSWRPTSAAHFGRLSILLRLAE